MVGRGNRRSVCVGCSYYRVSLCFALPQRSPRTETSDPPEGERFAYAEQSQGVAADGCPHRACSFNFGYASNLPSSRSPPPHIPYPSPLLPLCFSFLGERPRKKEGLQLAPLPVWQSWQSGGDCKAPPGITPGLWRSKFQFPGSPEKEGECCWRCIVCNRFFTGFLNTLKASFALLLLLPPLTI